LTGGGSPQPGQRETLDDELKPFSETSDASVEQNGPLLGGFPTNNPPGDNAIAYDRTTRQVLNIVYGAKDAKKGLFFPNGLNGIITS
jgi:hypothetical protein